MEYFVHSISAPETFVTPYDDYGARYGKTGNIAHCTVLMKDDPNLFAFDLLTRTRLPNLVNVGNDYCTAALSEDGNHVFLGYLDGHIAMFDSQTG